MKMTVTATLTFDIDWEDYPECSTVEEIVELEQGQADEVVLDSIMTGTCKDVSYNVQVEG